MVSSDLPEIPKYISNFIKDKHRFNEDCKTKDNLADIFLDALSYGYPNEAISKYISKNSDTFAKAWLIGYKIKGEDR
ncbi:hypothetical protein SAC12B_0057 [Lactobacillus phage SAC12B]|uniref:Uncharacterized protein n=1 Tax=Lactobacillus phage SAC12B TaxID=2510941 RepID=A0A4Y5FFI2_9CAUD|nr:hypothetical protein HWC10_gp057 [Lactobacillus phage SAC12B]QBJ03846.1 hypothetical protein SAC12B_0057 [Lactobacillus phage SAC12B]